MTQTACEKKLESLNEKIAAYEELLEQYSQEPKVIGKIISGPENDEGKTFYRVSVEGSQQVCEYKVSHLFKNNDIKLEPGAEVAVTKANIVGVLPQSLIKVDEDLKFDAISWDQIGGLKSQIQRIRSAVEVHMNNAALVKEFGLEPVKGVLLYGAPGCGKTLIAKAIASTVLAHKNAKAEAFVYVKGAEILSKYVGEAEARIANMFKQCRQYARKNGHRAVIFIDEADALLPQRGSRRSSDIETTTVPTFLSEMDGFDTHAPIVILSTNFPGSLDEAIVRPGRIDIKINVDRPTKEDAVDIFKIHLKPVKTKVDHHVLATYGSELIFENGLTKKASGALIQTVVKLATQLAVDRAISTGDKSGITTDDIKQTIETIKTT